MATWIARALTTTAHHRRRSRSRLDRRPPSRKPASTPTGIALRSDIVADLDELGCTLPRLVLQDHLGKGRPPDGVPLRSQALTDDVEGPLPRHSLPIGPGGGH